MKLIRYGAAGSEKPGILDSAGHIRDISALVPDISSATLGTSPWESLKHVDVSSLPDLGPASAHRLGPCVSGVGKLVCMGINEKTHTEQIKAGPGAKPTIFLKPTSAINGPNDPILYPKVGKMVDWENELAIVIGKRGKYINEIDARSYVAGFCIVNDVSDRHWQTDASGKYTLITAAKSFDTFAPLGPYLVTPDEMTNPDSLSLKLWVNGELRQDFNSADYIYNVDQVVAYCSQFFTLHPGDVIAMGSGPGNGFYWNQFLNVGDTIRAEVEGLGVQECVLVAEE